MASPSVTFALDIDDVYLNETGFQVSMTSPRVWAGRSKVVGGIMWEPLTQTVMLTPLQDFTDYPTADTADWTFSDGVSNWEAVEDIPGFDYGSALFHRTTAAAVVTVTDKSSWDYNPFTLIGLYLYYPDTSNNYIDFSWGGGDLVLRLQPGEHPKITFDSKEWSIDTVPALTAEDLYWKNLRLYVYFIRETMIVWSNFMPPFAWRPPRVVWDEHTWNDGTNDHIYLVGQGAFALSAPGMFYFNAEQMIFFKSPDTDAEADYFVRFTLPYVPTEDPSTELVSERFPNTMTSVAIRNADDTGSYQTGDQSGLVRLTLYTGDDEVSPIINRVLVAWDRVTAARSGAGYELPALVVSEERSMEPGADLLRITALDDGTFEDLQQVGNMRASLAIDGTSRLVGYVDRPTKRIEGGTSFYDFSLRDVMRKLMYAPLTFEYVGDGKEVSAALSDIVKMAGVQDADIDFDTSEVIFPDERDAYEPAILFPGGTSIYEACMYVMTNWLPGWRLYGRYDGKYKLEQWTAGTPVTTFTMAADTGVEDPTDIIQGTLEEFCDDSLLCNYLLAGSVDKDGNMIVVVKEDSDSWETPGSDNYVGERRIRYMIDFSMTTMDALDAQAQAVFDEFNRIRRFFRWRTKYNPTIFPGDVATIEGKGDVKITDMYTRIEKNLGETEFFGEYIPE